MKEVKLGNKEYFHLVIGQSPPGHTYNKKGNGLPFFQGKTDFGILNPIPSVWCTAPARIAEKGDILISVRAPVGPVNIATERCCIGRGLAAIRTTPKVYPKYVYWMLKNQEALIAKDGNGSMFNSITKDQLYNVTLMIPDTIDEQIAISKLIDDKFELLESAYCSAVKQIEALKALPSAILRESLSISKDIK